MPKKTSWTNNQLIEAITNAVYWQDVYEKINSTRTVIKNRIQKLNISINHLKYKKRFQTQEARKLISDKRKLYLKANPIKWSNPKNETFPETIFKQALEKLNVKAVMYYIPPENDRFFELDFAIPELKIAFEVNGNFHYESDNILKTYYQVRHDYFINLGWTVHEIHYSKCIKLDSTMEMIKCLLKGNSYNLSTNIINYRQIRNIQKQELNKIKKQKYELDALEKLKMLSQPEFEHYEKLLNKDYYKTLIKIHRHDITTSKRRVIWPSKDKLQILIDSTPMTIIGKMYGVSDNAVRKWCKRLHVIKNNVGVGIPS